MSRRPKLVDDPWQLPEPVEPAVEEDEPQYQFVRPEALWPLLDGVVGQDVLKTKLVSAFSQFSLFLSGGDDSRPLVLVAGPSGSGKTMAIERLVRGYEEITGQALPYTIVNSAQVSPPAFKGQTMKDVLIQHWMDHRTDTGIIFLDEFDKWLRGAIGSDTEAVSMGLRQQAEILKYVESDAFSFIDEAKDIEALEGLVFETGRLMWILAGAFNGLDKIVQAGLGNAYYPVEEVLDHALPKDFIRYGMMPELVNRVGTWAYARPLTAHQILEILQQQEVPRWQRRFAAIGCALDLQTGVLGECASRGIETRTGARGAASMLRRAMDDIFVVASRHRQRQVAVSAAVLHSGHIVLEETG